MMDRKFSLTARLKSFSYAFQGLRTFFRTQHNSFIHVAAALAAIAAGFYFSIPKSEWLWVIVVIALVFITEMLNTALEFLCDHITPGIHPEIKKIKDVSAAAVLIAAAAAVVTGGVIFGPRIAALF